MHETSGFHSCVLLEGHTIYNNGGLLLVGLGLLYCMAAIFPCPF